MNKQIEIGTRIYTGLYNRGAGIVFAIHGEQKPETVRSVLSGVMVSGGNAKFDIVFLGGGFSMALPECIIHGVQWEIEEGEKATAEEIAEVLAAAYAKQASEKAAEAIAKQKYADECERLKGADEYKHLTQVSQENHSGGKLVAKNIRVELKKSFPGVKFSVKSDYSSVNIRWTDGPTEEKVNEIAGKYKAGSFNGMEDMYEYSRSPWGDVFGDVQYISTRREDSPEQVEKAIQILTEKYPENMKALGFVPTVADFERGAYLHIDFYGEGSWSQYNSLQRKIHEVLDSI